MKSNFTRKINIKDREFLISINSSNQICQGFYKSTEYIIIGNLQGSMTLNEIIADKSTRNLFQDLNGEFCIFLFHQDKLQVVSDRFNSVPIYYSIDRKNVIISDNLIFLKKELQLNEYYNEVFFEFLYFQKINGDKTILKNIKKLLNKKK